jgi:LacI family transcriptional regulator
MKQRKSIRLKDISERANVSLATVSMSLSGHPDISQETKDRVRGICQQLGYKQRRQIQERKATAESRSLRFGLMLMGRMMDDDPMFHSLGAEAARIGARIEFHASEADDMPEIDKVLEFARGVSGLILTGIVDGNMLDALDKGKVPHVVLGYATSSPKAESEFGQIVTSDMVAMGRIATEYLLENGHQQIGFICERMPKGLWAARWLRGHHIALSEKGVPPNPDLVHVTGLLKAGGAAVDAMLGLKKVPTAYIIPDARVAGSFVAAMRARGITLSTDSIVISGIHSQVELYGMSQYPWIGNKIDHFAKVVVRQLRQIIQEPMPCATEVHVPFGIRNLSVLADKNSLAFRDEH